jgi:glutaredoxin
VQRPENVSEKLEESKLTDNTENIVYGKKDCLFCVSACSLLDARKIEYEYVDIEELGKTAAEVTGRADVRTVPQIYLDGAYIGGFNQLLEHFKRPAESTECVACEG